MNIKCIPIGGTNCYLVNSNEKYYLIDSGPPSHGKLLLKQLEALGVSDKIKLLILTHGHKDHIGNAAELKRKLNIEILMHKDDLELINKEDSELKARSVIGHIGLKLLPKGVSDQFESFEPDMIFDGDLCLREYGFDANLIHVPGHTNGSVAVLAEDKLFAGDLFMNIFSPSRSLFAMDFSLLDESVERIGKYNVQKIFPGHGKYFLLNKPI